MTNNNETDTKMIHSCVITLDSLNIKNPVSLVKIDVEGFENHVLAGGVQFFDLHRPTLFIELWSKTPEKTAAVQAQLDLMGYELNEHIGGDDYVYKHR